MKILKFTAVAALAAFVSGHATANSVSKAIADDDAPYADVTSLQAIMPNGVSTYEIELETAIDPADLSVWYAPSRSCSQFAVHEVSYVDANGDWQKADMNVFQSTAHYRTAELTSKLAITIGTDRIFGMRCNIFIKKANFAVPDTFEMIARYASTCDTDDVCSHNIIRIDSDRREVITISDADAKLHNLQAGSIYKLKGYLQPQDGSVETFVILSSQKVM